MREFIEYLLKEIVTKPEEVKVSEEPGEGENYFVYRISVSQDDMGLVIGKEGRTIKSLRTLARSRAIKNGQRVNLELMEANENV
jgi:uncharacterized protein